MRNPSRIFRKLSLSLLLAIIVILQGRAQVLSTRLHGKIQQDGKPVSGAIINLYAGDKIAFRAKTDEAGQYDFSNIESGTYTVRITGSDGDGFEVGNYTVVYGKSETRDWNIGVTIGKVDIHGGGFEGEKPFSRDQIITCVFITRKDFTHLPTRNPLTAIYMYSSEVSPVNGDPRNGLQVRGGRTGATGYYVDGVKMLGEPGLPAQAIGEVQVLTGGIPAEYGDITGGVVVINTSNPGMFVH